MIAVCYVLKKDTLAVIEPMKQRIELSFSVPLLTVLQPTG